MSGGIFSLTILDQRPNIVILEVSGKNAKAAFANEAGGHRFQRVPETEKHGRVQTSTITVAVLPPLEARDLDISSDDIDWTAFRGSGKGGQKRNKTASAVRVVHKPTGIVVRYESERSQSQNLRVAKAILASRVEQQLSQSERLEQSTSRRMQCGAGCRGDKRRTIRVRDDKVTDHKLGRTTSWRLYLRGELEIFNEIPPKSGD